MEFTLLLSGALLLEDFPPEHRPPLFADLAVPALHKLLARGYSTSKITSDFPALASSTEYWLAQRFATPAGISAPYCAALDGLTDSANLWSLQPVHFHVARDHIVLNDPAQLTIDAEEADALLVSIAPLLSEPGWSMTTSNQRWYLNALLHLQAATVDAAIGRNIDVYLPTGNDARRWKRLLNEIQMVWHTHPVNAAREARGELPVNSVWLYGGSATPLVPPKKPFEVVYANLRYAQALAAASGAAYATTPSTPRLAHASILHLEQRLQQPLAAQDWYAWRNHWLQLEHDFLQPLLDLLGRRILKRLTVVLCGEQQAVEYVVTPNDLWKFWRNASLEHRLSESSAP